MSTHAAPTGLQPGVEYVPIRHLAPFAVLGNRVVLAVILRSYYDSSGTASDPNTPCVTLAGYTASYPVWEQFEHEWAEMLAKYQARVLHMSDLHAVPRRGEFAEWSSAQADAFLSDVMRVIGQAANYADVSQGIVGASCTVDKEAYRRACDALPWLAKRKPLEALCVDAVIDTALRQLPADPNGVLGKKGRLELYFDRNEPFQKHIHAAWERSEDPVFKLIDTIAAHRNEPFQNNVGCLPFQAADFLAWQCMRGRVSQDMTTKQQHQFTSILTAPAYSKVYDYDTIMARAKALEPDD